MNDLDSADPNIQTAILEVVAEGLSAAVLLYDKNDLLVFASQQFSGLLRVPKSLLQPGARLRDLLAAMYDAGIRMAADTFGYRRTLSREDWVADQIAGLWKERSETLERSGPDRWLSVVKRRLPSGYGICVVKDVSEQKKREEQWRLDNERVQVTEEVLDNLPFPVSVKDRNSVFVAVNKAASEFLDLPAESILGYKSADIHPTALEQRLGPINQLVYESGEPVQIPERITRPDGSTVVVIVHKYRIGKPGRYYLVTVKQDVSALAADASEEGQLPPHLRTEDLVQTDLSRAPRQERPVEEAAIGEPIDAKVLVVAPSADIETEAISALRRNGIDVSGVSGADELALFLQLALEADIRIDLVVVDASMPPECAQVADAHGVPALCFDPRRTGASLPALVRAELRKASEPPVPALAEDWSLQHAGDEQAIDILVAEDNEVNQIVFSQIIESFGYRYALAVDGEEAVRLWRERSPRLVLMDVTLPKLTGFEASAAIRALENDVAPVPIVGILAQAFDRDREACFEAGMDDVILKPISPEALDTVFKKFLYSRRNEMESGASSTS
jgi:PAS domain S-box-containing protein